MKITTVILFLFYLLPAHATTYYSDSGNSDLNDTNNWWTNSDNTGSHPIDFTGTNTYIMQTGHIYTTSANWDLGRDLQVNGSLTINHSVNISRNVSGSGIISINTGVTVDVANNISGTASIIFTGNADLRIGNSFTNTGIFTPSVGTVTYYAGGNGNQTCKLTTYHHLVIDKTIAKRLSVSGATTINGDLTINSGDLYIGSLGVVTVTGTTTLATNGVVRFSTNDLGDLNLNDLIMTGGKAGSQRTGNMNCTSLFVSGTTNTINRCNFTNSGTTTVNGTLNFSHTRGIKTFIGDIIVNGSLTNTIGESITIGGSLTNNGTINLSGGTSTFTGVGKVFDGSSSNTTLYNASMAGDYTNFMDTLIFTMDLKGAGSLINGANKVIAIGDDATITTLDVTAIPNTIIYNGASSSQTAKIIDYFNLIIDNTAGLKVSFNGSVDVSNECKVLSGILDINGGGSQLTGNNLTMADGTQLNVQTSSGTATIPQFMGTYSLSPTSTIRFDKGNGNQTIDGTGIVFGNIEFGSNGKKNLASDIYAAGNLIINGGAILDVSTNNYNINVSGDWINIATDIISFKSRSGVVTFDGNGTQTITRSGGATKETFNDVNIELGANTELNSSVLINNDLNINGMLNVTGQDTISINGSWSNNGSFTPDNGLVEFTGISPQSVNGNNTFNDLTINNVAGVSIVSHSDSLVGTLLLTGGTLNTNDSLVLISNANGTARIAEITGGDIIGDITMQRYIDEGATSWRFFSSATNGATLADWNDDFITSGFTGSDFPTFPFTSIYFYDETVLGPKDDGFVPATNAANTVDVGEGIWVWCGDNSSGTSPFTIDIKGIPNKGAIDLPVSYSSTGSPDDDGWCMVGNPYPSTIDWDAAGWMKTNINDAIYIWHPDLQQFSSYISGVGVNGGGNLIPSSQSFWVHANASNPFLQITESVKSATDAGFIKQSTVNPGMKIKVIDGTIYDEIVVRTFSEATDQFDPSFDALKMKSLSESVPFIATVIEDSLQFSINTLGSIDMDKKIPLNVQVPFTNSYDLLFEGVSNIDASCLFLEDLFLDSIIDLTDNNSYSCILYDTTTSSRFVLHLGAKFSPIVSSLSCNSSNDGAIEMTGQGDGPWDIEVYNSVNDTVQLFTAFNSLIHVTELASDTFEVHVSNNGACGNVSSNVVVEEPLPVISQFSIPKDTLLVDEGVIFENFSQNSSYFEWDFGDGYTSTEASPYHQYIEPGNYTITLMASENNCFDSITRSVIVISSEVDISSSFENLVVYTDNGNIILENLPNECDKIEVSNLMGQIVFTTENIPHKAYSIKMLSTSGVYILNVFKDNVRQNVKVILE